MTEEELRRLLDVIEVLALSVRELRQDFAQEVELRERLVAALRSQHILVDLS